MRGHWLSTLVILTLAATLAACSGGEPPAGSTPSPQAQQTSSTATPSSQQDEPTATSDTEAAQAPTSTPSSEAPPPGEYGEAPSLAERVSSGDLPPSRSACPQSLWSSSYWASRR